MKNILVALSLFVGMFVHADEGMWFLMFLDRLNQRDMEKMGLQLTSEEIYSINNSSKGCNCSIQWRMYCRACFK